MTTTYLPPGLRVQAVALATVALQNTEAAAREARIDTQRARNEYRQAFELLRGEYTPATRRAEDAARDALRAAERREAQLHTEVLDARADLLRASQSSR